jgi:hypothetical protein
VATHPSDINATLTIRAAPRAFSIEKFCRRYGVGRTKAVPFLIAVSDVEQVFSDLVVRELARTLKFPASADIGRFGLSVRTAARIFLETKGQLNAPQLRAAVARLYRLISRAERCDNGAALALAGAVDTLPALLRRWLTSCNRPHNRDIPRATEIRSLVTRQNAVERLRLIVSYGSRVVPGRKCPGGRRSRSVKPLLRVPETARRGRPSGLAERELVQWLAIAYLEGAGHPPPILHTTISDFGARFLDLSIDALRCLAHRAAM